MKPITQRVVELYPFETDTRMRAILGFCATELSHGPLSLDRVFAHFYDRLGSETFSMCVDALETLRAHAGVHIKEQTWRGRVVYWYSADGNFNGTHECPQWSYVVPSSNTQHGPDEILTMCTWVVWRGVCRQSVESFHHFTHRLEVS